MVRSQSSMIVFVLLSSIATVLAQPKIGIPEIVEPSGLRHAAEFRFDMQARYQNPYDPDEIRVDALVIGPSGQNWVAPAFWFEPYSRTVEESKLELDQIRLFRFYISASEFGKNQTIRFALDDIELLNSKTGVRRIIDDFEGDIRWQAQQGVTIEKSDDQTHGGKSALHVTIVTNEEGSGWPGVNLSLNNEDWSAYDSIRIWVRPLRGLERGTIGCEFYNVQRHKFQTHIYEPSAIIQPPTWHESEWMLRAPMPRSVWAPAGQGSWRVRLAVPEDGDYSIRLKAKDASGETEGATATFQLKRTEPDGFLRVDENTKRYLRFDSGKAYLASGTNLISSDVTVNEYYVPKFAAAGCNFMRFWLSGRSLGIERDKLTQYDQERAAALDVFVNLARDHNTYLMFCLTDFREAGDYHDQHYWKDVAYSKVCDTPHEFFRGETAIHAYQKRLRYVVARWSASAAVHSWEFFNEVNITNSWKDEPDSVRTWHRIMAEHLRAIDPYKHVITSSFAQIEDDDLWTQPLMQISQRHFYTGDFVSFADALSEATRILEHHEKPSLVGEFGRAKNRYTKEDAEGVSLHNGIWAPPMSGSSGTGMPWWWEWIDQYDLYRHYAAFSEFVKDVRWHEEGFVPIEAKDIKTEIADDPKSRPLQVVRITPVSGSFQEATFNRPVTVTVKNDGTLDPPDLISNFPHGIRHHKDLHNPQTFRVNFPEAGTFNVYVGGVSGHGGATLKIVLDGEVKLDKPFTDASKEDTQMMTEYNGCYSVDVPPGEHTITLENTGTDWFRMPLITLTNYGEARPEVEVLGLRGKQSCLLWVRNATYVWYAPLVDLKPVAARDVVLRMSGLDHGKYEARLFDPQTGKWLKTLNIEYNGGIAIPLGTIVKDMAVRLTKK
ncbi:MAG: cellulase family glycosylhydrolase [Planctomycetota bacterium]